jgi:hypothetical protein
LAGWIRNHEARIGALGAGLDAGDDALNPAPACGAVVEFLVAAQLVRSTTHGLAGGAIWLSSQRVAARDVLHIYRKRRPGQLRDVSWLAPVLTRLCDLGDYEAPC